MKKSSKLNLFQSNSNFTDNFTPHSIRKSIANKNVSKVRQDFPCLYVDIIRARRMAAKNTYVVISFEGNDYLTNIVWKDENPEYNEFFILYVTISQNVTN